MPLRIKMFLTFVGMSLIAPFFLVITVPNFSKLFFEPSGSFFLIMLFAIIVVITLASLLIATYFTLPITDLRMVMQRTKLGKFSQRASIHAKDEVGDLAVAFNEMIDTIQWQLRDLEISKAEDEAILSAIGDGLVVIDKEGKILFINKAFETILGWSEKDVVGKQMVDILRGEDESGKPVPAQERAVIAALGGISTANTVTNAWYYIRKDKTKFPVASIITSVIVGGKIIGAVEVFRDITKEKELDRAKTEFVSLASHQLKTPPTAIKLLTERILSGKMGKLTERQSEYINDIHSSNRRMIVLVNTLLNVSRIELGSFNLKLTEQNVCSIVQNVFDELRPIAEKKELTLKLISQEKEVKLMLDESLFHIVVNNLLTNAIYYTGDKGEVTAECQKGLKGQLIGGKKLDKDYFIISVADNGTGIPSVEQKKIFTKFFRAENAKEKRPDGSGLGLYITKSIMDNAGGMLWFTSKENEGSTFYIALLMTGMKGSTGGKDLSA